MCFDGNLRYRKCPIFKFPQKDANHGILFLFEGVGWDVLNYYVGDLERFEKLFLK